MTSVLSDPSVLDHLPLRGQRGEFVRLLSKLRETGEKDGALAVCLTSALSGEGTSTIAAQFAASAAAAQQDSRVILVEGNLQTPAVHELMDLDNEVGVIDVCDGQRAVDEVIQRTEATTLDAITAGAQGKTLAPGTLDTLPFSALIRELRNHYSLVVVDCSPLASGSAGTHLPRKEALTVLVVQASATRREVVQGAAHELALMSAEPVGMLLNRRKYFIPSFVYRRI